MPSTVSAAEMPVSGPTATTVVGSTALARKKSSDSMKLASTLIPMKKPGNAPSAESAFRQARRPRLTGGGGSGGSAGRLKRGTPIPKGKHKKRVTVTRPSSVRASDVARRQRQQAQHQHHQQETAFVFPKSHARGGSLPTTVFGPFTYPTPKSAKGTGISAGIAHPSYSVSLMSWDSLKKRKQVRKKLERRLIQSGVIQPIRSKKSTVVLPTSSSSKRATVILKGKVATTTTTSTDSGGALYSTSVGMKPSEMSDLDSSDDEYWADPKHLSGVDVITSSEFNEEEFLKETRRRNKEKIAEEMLRPMHCSGGNTVVSYDYLGNQSVKFWIRTKNGGIETTEVLLALGDVILAGGYLGILRYLGKAESMKGETRHGSDSLFMGLECMESVEGGHRGIVGGTKYFVCSNERNTGVLLPLSYYTRTISSADLLECLHKQRAKATVCQRSLIEQAKEKHSVLKQMTCLKQVCRKLIRECKSAEAYLERYAFILGTDVSSRGLDKSANAQGTAALAQRLEVIENALNESKIWTMNASRAAAVARSRGLVLERNRHSNTKSPGKSAKPVVSKASGKSVKSKTKSTITPGKKTGKTSTAKSGATLTVAPSEHTKMYSTGKLGFTEEERKAQQEEKEAAAAAAAAGGATSSSSAAIATATGSSGGGGPSSSGSVTGSSKKDTGTPSTGTSNASTPAPARTPESSNGTSLMVTEVSSPATTTMVHTGDSEMRYGEPSVRESSQSSRMNSLDKSTTSVSVPDKPLSPGSPSLDTYGALMPSESVSTSSSAMDMYALYNPAMMLGYPGYGIPMGYDYNPWSMQLAYPYGTTSYAQYPAAYYYGATTGTTAGVGGFHPPTPVPGQMVAETPMSVGTSHLRYPSLPTDTGGGQGRSPKRRDKRSKRRSRKKKYKPSPREILTSRARSAPAPPKAASAGSAKAGSSAADQSLKDLRKRIDSPSMAAQIAMNPGRQMITDGKIQSSTFNFKPTLSASPDTMTSKEQDEDTDLDGGIDLMHQLSVDPDDHGGGVGDLNHFAQLSGYSIMSTDLNEDLDDIIHEEAEEEEDRISVMSLTPEMVDATGFESILPPELEVLAESANPSENDDDHHDDEDEEEDDYSLPVPFGGFKDLASEERKSLDLNLSDEESEPIRLKQLDSGGSSAKYYSGKPTVSGMSGHDTTNGSGGGWVVFNDDASGDSDFLGGSDSDVCVSY